MANAKEGKEKKYHLFRPKTYHIFLIVKGTVSELSSSSDTKITMPDSQWYPSRRLVTSSMD